MQQEPKSWRYLLIQYWRSWCMSLTQLRRHHWASLSLSFSLSLSMCILHELINFRWCCLQWDEFVFFFLLFCSVGALLHNVYLVLSNFIRISIKIWMVHEFGVDATNWERRIMQRKLDWLYFCYNKNLSYEVKRKRERERIPWIRWNK